jgi:hypothetical protein
MLRVLNTLQLWKNKMGRMCTLSCIEVGTISGSIQLDSHATCLNFLGVKGAKLELPGSNSNALQELWPKQW